MPNLDRCQGRTPWRKLRDIIQTQKLTQILELQPKQLVLKIEIFFLLETLILSHNHEVLRSQPMLVACDY